MKLTTIKEQLQIFLEKKAENIKNDLLKLAITRSPKDTGTFEEEGITAIVIPSSEGFQIQIFVNNVLLNYPGKSASIEALKLGMILNVGIGVGGALLKRTQSKPLNQKGSPTAGWFDQFRLDAIEYLKRYGKS